MRRCYLVTNYNDKKSKHISAPDCFGVKDIEKVRKGYKNIFIHFDGSILDILSTMAHKKNSEKK